jgi:DNA-directed RNA polymerase subunit RPC12/RpoP
MGGERGMKVRCPYCGEAIEKLVCVAKELHVYEVEYDQSLDELRFHEDDCAELGFLAHGEFEEEEKYICLNCRKVVAESETEAQDFFLQSLRSAETKN